MGGGGVGGGGERWQRGWGWGGEELGGGGGERWQRGWQKRDLLLVVVGTPACLLCSCSPCS